MNKTNASIDINKKAQTRLTYIDYGKAVCICIVVYFHMALMRAVLGNTASVSKPAFSLTYCAAFILPFFFFASGLVYNAEKRSLKDDILRRFKQIMFPYWTYLPIITALEIIREIIMKQEGILTNIHKFVVMMLYGSSRLPFEIPALGITASSNGIVNVSVGPNSLFWFLPVMFCTCVITFCVLKLLRNSRSIPLRVAIIIILTSLSEIEPSLMPTQQLPFGLGRSFLAAAIMLTGYWLMKSGLFSIKSKLWNIIITLAAVGILLLTAYLNPCTYQLASSSYGDNGIWSLYLVYLNAVSGSVMLLQLCKLIEFIPFVKIKELIRSLGTNSLYILIFHWIIITVFKNISSALPYDILGETTGAMKIIVNLLFLILVLAISLFAGNMIEKYKAKRKKKNTAQA